MRKVYKDPMQELKDIMNSAEASRLSYIAISKEEMRSLVNHKDAVDIFPSLAGPLREMAQHKDSLKKIKVQKNNPNIFEAEKQKLFDREFEIETHLRKMEDAVPSQLKTKTGLIVRVSLR